MRVRAQGSPRAGRPGVLSRGSAWAAVSLGASGVVGRRGFSYLVAHTPGWNLTPGQALGGLAPLGLGRGARESAHLQGHWGMAQATHTSPAVLPYLVNTDVAGAPLASEGWGGWRGQTPLRPGKPWSPGGAALRPRRGRRASWPRRPESCILAAAVFKGGPGIWTSSVTWAALSPRATIPCESWGASP